MPKPASTFVLTRSPLVDPKTGMATWIGLKILQGWDVQLQNLTPAGTISFTDITGTILDAQLPPDGVTAIIPLAKLTPLGNDGNLAFNHGILTDYNPPT